MPTNGESQCQSTRQRARRTDATRNRERLLVAARELFDRRGVNIHLDEVARLANVGNATMYRHFPTRRELVVAVYADEVEKLCAEGRSLLYVESPGVALFCWLRSFILHVASRRELALEIPDDQSDRRSELFDHWHEVMHSTASHLLVRAQHAGVIRPELQVTDLLKLANGIALVALDRDQIDRLLFVLREGAQT